MTYLNKLFLSPGGETEGGNINPDNEENNVIPVLQEDDQKDKPIIEKIKEALQDWSNKDEQDQEFDDTRV
ncbi:MAG: hypothetical protein WKI04_02260 [Ferruginibacter sp.]